MSPNDLPAQSYPDLKSKKAIVTGGAAGIGFAIARALAAQEVMVTIADLNEAAAKEAADCLPGTHHWVAVDVRERQSVDTAFKVAVEKMGGLDILIANAGVSTMRPGIDLTDEDWDFNMNVNARGVFLCNQWAARLFLEQGHGVITNTASLAAKVGAPFLAHYSASKFAVVGWTQGLARELAPKGIRVNAVCPGLVKTSMQDREVQWEAGLRGMTPEEVHEDYIRQTPLGRIETPEDVAGVSVFLCSEAARFMTGQALNVTGGIYTT
ncbi:NAD(P)-dependent dehydrogenase (short-subunit alcohol dehydrogenase family) [Breoghania corrubedonensis]|uniref:NAD(P)-dependent dehydrogenase (Short-subunit alcohol dehydrogenase family) n=1 Tax=Breoghania corrubedonensis TaxID=665038 RepID=A0A2T5V8Y9_9HYPH|nr:SDR family NAD(P)-dependent oxidoreductase [Breoghania corrubedonensis]PTW60226.1 NAD(P)-dependent dehydrogenase (short-subunit alcohol dehydrogenase family) [Breoghania corrubedonensis]